MLQIKRPIGRLAPLYTIHVADPRDLRRRMRHDDVLSEMLSGAPLSGIPLKNEAKSVEKKHAKA